MRDPRAYLRTVRLLIGETRNLVHATRAELGAQLTELGAAAAEQARHHQAELARLQAEVAGLRAELQAGLAERDAAGARQHTQLLEGLRLLGNRGHAAREQLRALRAGAEYGEAFDDAEPLVSVVIPTYDRAELLASRSIPSVLAQTYGNFELLVVCDAGPDAVRAAVEGFGDPRMRFERLSVRGPYSEDPETAWRNSGTGPYNLGVALARGKWVAPLADDDAFRPEHLERMLAFARRERREVAYGRYCVHIPGSGTEIHGEFPPRAGFFGFQAAVYLTGIARLFPMEPFDSVLGVPNDWGMCLRMLEAGVAFGMTDVIGFDYFPSYFRRREDRRAE